MALQTACRGLLKAASHVEHSVDSDIRAVLNKPVSFHYKKNRFKAFIDKKDVIFPWLSAASRFHAIIG